MEKSIYMDNAATTRTDPEVVKAMMPFFTETYAVASSQFSHSPGLLAREGLDNAREIIAKKLGSSAEEILFTSGGTESNNLALKGLARASKSNKNHLICSAVEHNSVLHTCQWLEQQGYRLTTLDVNEEGFIDLDQLKDSITNETLLVSIQHGNQEVGTIQPIDEIAQICQNKGILYHTDASLSFTNLDLDISKLPIDLITLTAHKIHGPKGVGALFVRKETALRKIFHGGYSENDMRPGTENVSGAVGFGKAVELARSDDITSVRAMQKKLLQFLTQDLDGVLVNGPNDLDKRLPGNVNVSFDLIEGESVVLHLDMRGISVITGSACFSRSLEPSYVMMGMGFSHERAHGSIRFTLSKFNQLEEIDTVISACKEVVEDLRRISPLKNKE